jgi:hypothetical protein
MAQVCLPCKNNSKLLHAKETKSCCSMFAAAQSILKHQRVQTIITQCYPARNAPYVCLHALAALLMQFSARTQQAALRSRLQAGDVCCWSCCCCCCCCVAAAASAASSFR